MLRRDDEDEVVMRDDDGVQPARSAGALDEPQIHLTAACRGEHLRRVADGYRDAARLAKRWVVRGSATGARATRVSGGMLPRRDPPR